MTSGPGTEVKGDPWLVVGIGEMMVSAAPDETIITYALGSCLGFCIYDPVAKVGGMLHAMLPTSQLDPERARRNPARFVDSGVPALFKACYRLGASKTRIVTKVAGGARAVAAGEEDSFKIGKRNLIALKKMLWKNGVVLRGQDVGGSQPRTVSLCIADGTVLIKSGAESTFL